MMFLNFEPIDVRQQDAYGRILAKCPQPSSDYSFINLWGWADEYGLLWAWKNDLVWIQQTFPEPVDWAPIGDWCNADWPDILSSGHFMGSRMVTRVPEKLADIWKTRAGNRVTVESIRGHWDYLYASRDLMELKGNRYHNKKNLLNQFLANHQFQYTPMDAAITEKALSLQNDWCIWKDCESQQALAAENRVIEKILRNWNRLKGLSGAALLVQNELVAYTIAEQINPRMMIIHFEKGNPDYKGAYQAINQMFLEHVGNPDMMVNREQDLDDEGLRKAKLSYHPMDFLRKFHCTFH